MTQVVASYPFAPHDHVRKSDAKYIKRPQCDRVRLFLGSFRYPLYPNFIVLSVRSFKRLTLSSVLGFRSSDNPFESTFWNPTALGVFERPSSGESSRHFPTSATSIVLIRKLNTLGTSMFVLHDDVILMRPSVIICNSCHYPQFHAIHRRPFAKWLSSYSWVTTNSLLSHYRVTANLSVLSHFMLGKRL